MTHEQFTARARKVMQLANQEAHRFNHNHIGTEHILLGLVKEGSGVAANVLKNLDADLRKIGLEVEELVYGWPEIIMTGSLPQTLRAKKVIEHAMEEARNLKHNYVGTEHLLLGLIREQEGIAAKVLVGFGLDYVFTREAILTFLSQREADARDTAATLQLYEAVRITEHEGKKYLRDIYPADTIGQMIHVDVYSVLEAFDVTCPARAHATKKLLCAGQRGKGSVIDDLKGVLAAVNRAIELELKRVVE